MDRFKEIGAKTGLTAKEVRRVTRFGALGLLALALASLSACFRAQKPAREAGAKPATLHDLADPAKEASPAAGEKPAAPAAADGEKAADNNCGPYPGYPCGTRYYTVSRADFGRPA
ncbi:MAG TPA: hypothetical protein DCZ92_09885 [Elusimicrobia bacterium]|nr:MAG: hypothetical protein A2016_05300 [Elusimicrobia bacterium GWF2_62_30]HBA61110.1 hypothetical protein [Elusimicrobiota bacterium]